MSLNRKKRALIIVLASMLLLTICGCSIIQENQYAEKPVEISPENKTASSAKTTVNLYFRYAAEELLTVEQRELTVPSSEMLESAAMHALLGGPANAGMNITRLFNDNAELVSIQLSKDVLNVVLSREFLDPPEEAPDDWQNNPGWRDEIMMRRRLAIWSIVNTMTDIGNCSSVLVLLETGEGDGTWIKRSEAGFEDDPEAPLEPLSRNMEVVLSPGRSAERVLDSLRMQDINSAYDLIAVQDVDGKQKPALEEFGAEFEEYGSVIEAFKTGNVSVSQDGKSAVLSVEYSLRDKDGTSSSYLNVPIKLVWEDGIWKLAYQSFQLLFTER